MSEKKPDTERFFLADQEHRNLAGKKVIEKDVLFFEFHKNQKLGEPVDLVCRANEDHIKNFPDAYKAFSEPKVEVVVEPIAEPEEEPKARVRKIFKKSE